MSDSEPHSSDNEMSDSDPDDESSPLRVILTVGDRETLLKMMTALDEEGIAVRTEDIARSTFDESDTTTLDLRSLTEKQRDTLRIALETGYYEQPRKADLSDLAERLGVSKSAVSQRLRTAEAKLVKNAFDEYK